MTKHFRHIGNALLKRCPRRLTSCRPHDPPLTVYSATPGIFWGLLVPNLMDVMGVLLDGPHNLVNETNRVSLTFGSVLSMAFSMTCDMRT